MEHLIVGAGVIGKRYANILSTLGDSVILYDPLVFNQSNSLKEELQSFNGESVLLCTYPELHLTQLNDVIDAGLPCFVEKPVISRNYDETLLQGILERNRPITMVSCNWRFCPCIRDFLVYDLNLYYKARDVYAEMDLIHFIDLFWHDIDKSNFKLDLNFKNGIYSFESKYFKVNLNTKSQEVKSFQLGASFHTKYCNMFVKQIELWRDVVLKKTDSPNPFDMAAERTLWLMDKIEGAKKNENS